MKNNDLEYDHYLVEGMMSAECAATIRSAIEGIAGVREASVSIASGTLAVLRDRDRDVSAAVECAVTELGYGMIHVPLPGASDLPRRRRSFLENRRITLTILVAPLWIALLVATKARGFETAPYKLLELAGFALVFSAVLGRVWCAIYIGGRKDRELCKTGPYSLSRNPLYFFSFLGAVGICLAARNPLLAAATGALFLGYYHMIMRAEERRLEALFAGQYRVWAQAVPRFFLSLRIPDQVAEITVNTKTFGRSLLDASWFLFAIIGVELIESSRSTLLGSGWLLPF